MNFKNILNFGLVIMGLLFSCTKTNISSSASDTNTNSIVGKWSIVNSSTVLKSKTIDPFIRNYIGTQNDYYDFKENGCVYIKEDRSLNTLNYKVTNNNTIVFSYKNVIVDSLNITSLNSNTAILTMNKTLDFDQTLEQIRNLKR